VSGSLWKPSNSIEAQRSFRAQSVQRIDTGSAARRNVAGKERRNRQDDRHSRKGWYVPCSGDEEEITRQGGGSDGANNPGPDPDHGERACLSEYQRADTVVIRAQGHADTDFAVRLLTEYATTP
jgi:hypothetical protein